MATTMDEALAALEQVAGRIERLEGHVTRHRADAGRLREEVTAVIRDLDQMIDAQRTHEGSADD